MYYYRQPFIINAFNLLCVGFMGGCSLFRCGKTIILFLGILVLLFDVFVLLLYKRYKILTVYWTALSIVLLLLRAIAGNLLFVFLSQLSIFLVVPIFIIYFCPDFGNCKRVKIFCISSLFFLLLIIFQTTSIFVGELLNFLRLLGVAYFPIEALPLLTFAFPVFCAAIFQALIAIRLRPST